jgi:hypothetical protein
MSCGGLVVAEFPLATSIGTSAFYSCFELVTANFPVVETIGATAFQNCTALRTLNIPAATAIDNNAFQDTDQGINKEDAEATELTVTLGTVTPPTLGATLFFATPGAKSIAKSVIVKVPVAGTAGYGSSPTDTTTDNWGNAFRGKGWNGTNYLTGTVNEKIMLTIET